MSPFHCETCRAMVCKCSITGWAKRETLPVAAPAAEAPVKPDYTLFHPRIFPADKARAIAARVKQEVRQIGRAHV